MKFSHIRPRWLQRAKPQWLLLAAALAVALALVASASWMRPSGSGLERLLASAMQRGVITGHSEDGTFYRLHVRAAVLDRDKDHYHHLTEPRAAWAFERTDEEEKLELRLRAPVGELDSKAQKLFLPQTFEIRIADMSDDDMSDNGISDGGMSDKDNAEPLADETWVLRSARGTILLRDNHLASDAPAHASNASTEIRSQRMEWDHGARRLIFRGQVESRWLPEQARRAAP